MKTIEEMIRQAEGELKETFARIDENEALRTKQVLDAFRKQGVSYRHFAPSTGYGYDDIGRDTLERIYADLFHTEAALMRPHVASGTAALSLTMFGMTRPGEFGWDSWTGCYFANIPSENRCMLLLEQKAECGTTQFARKIRNMWLAD